MTSAIRYQHAVVTSSRRDVVGHVTSPATDDNNHKRLEVGYIRQNIIYNGICFTFYVICVFVLVYFKANYNTYIHTYMH